MRIRRIALLLATLAFGFSFYACDDGETVAPECGNGVVEDGEECDDANTVSGDGCSAECKNETVTPECGNGVVEDGEECDDANTVSGDGCSAECKNESVTPECGNGVLEDGEECDDANTVSGDGCSAECKNETVVPECGNGVLEDGEECDDNEPDCVNCKFTQPCPPSDGAKVKLLNVTDADTINVRTLGRCKSGWHTIRIHGIDTPECTKQKGDNGFYCIEDKNYTDKNDPLGYEAYLKAKELIEGTNNGEYITLNCEVDPEKAPICQIDGTGKRYLAYFDVEHEGELVDYSTIITKLGYAFAYTLFSSTKMGELCTAEYAARNDKVGVWSLGQTLEELREIFSSGKDEFLTDEHWQICDEAIAALAD